MKRDKRSLILGHKTLLEHSFSTLQKLKCRKINVVIANDSDELSNFPTVTDIYKNRGTLGGIHSALANCTEEYALIIAVDYPFISAELLNFLIETAEDNNFDCIAPIQKDNIIQPLCAVYRTGKCLPLLAEMLENSKKTPSAISFVQSIDTRFIMFDEINALPNAEHFFFNLNTPADYLLAQEIFNDR